MTDTELAQLRKCEAAECEYKVPNGAKDITQIIGVLNRHILASHPVRQKPAGGGSVKLSATLPILEEGISENQYQAWLYRFERYCVSCKLTDDEIKKIVCLKLSPLC